MEFKIIYVNRHYELKCEVCQDEDWGRFMNVPNVGHICGSCIQKVIREIKVDDYRNSIE